MDIHNIDGMFNKNIREFKSSVNDLREKMNKLLKMCDSTDFKQNEAFDTLQEGLVNLIEIKYFNAEVQKELEIFKDHTGKEREKAEEKNLNYQNYQYQKESIISQINYCSNYPTEEMNKIKFSEREKILEYYASKENEVDNRVLDTMDYLKYELEMRKNFDEKLKSLAQENESNEAKLKEKEKYFRELPHYLKDLELSSIKAQNYLNLDITLNHTNSVLSEKLPQPLFVLYNSLLCLDKSKIEYELKILGREEDIPEYYDEYPLGDNINFDLIRNKIDKAESISRSYSKSKSKSKSKTKKKHKDNKEEGEHTDSGEVNESDINEVDREDMIDLIREKKDETKLLTKKSKRNPTINNQNSNKLATSIMIDQNELNIINLPKIKKFPLFLHFKINTILDNSSQFSNLLMDNVNDNILPICINFYYLPIVNVVTAELFGENKNSVVDLTTNQIMSNLFIPPSNLLSSFKLEINKAINFLCEESSINEKFYDYLQVMGNNVNYNLTYLKKICDIVKNKNEKYKTNIEDLFENKESYFDSPMKITTDNFISLIIKRIAFLPNVLNQIDFLIKNMKILPEASIEIKKEKRFNLMKEKSIISDVKKITQHDYLKIYQENFDNDFSDENFKIISIFDKDEEGYYYKKFLKVPLTFYTDEEAIYLSITIQRKSAKLTAYIEIGLDYPESTPKFILKIESDSPKTINDKTNHLYSESNDLIIEMNGHANNYVLKSGNKLHTRLIRDIERELNEYHHEYCAEELKQYLLSYQLRTMIMCFDIFYDIQNDKLNPTLIQSNTENKKKIPLKFNESKNIFELR